jgi:hypothetical protein
MKYIHHDCVKVVKFVPSLLDTSVATLMKKLTLLPIALRRKEAFLRKRGKKQCDPS